MLRTRRRRLAAIAAGIVVAVAAFLVLTAFTGLPGPGPLRRYKASQLEEMVSAVHDSAGSLRTPDDCWQTLQLGRPGTHPSAVASIDWVRSRVVVGMRSDNVGSVDLRTRKEIRKRLADIVATHPGLSSDMVVIEPSPEGWSPLMSCSLVVRGWGGF